MDAVTDRIWAEGLTRIPYWLYTDPDVLALEQKRLFEGPVWNYLCLETEIAQPGDWPKMATSAPSRTGARIAVR